MLQTLSKYFVITIDVETSKSYKKHRDILKLPVKQKSFKVLFISIMPDILTRCNNFYLIGDLKNPINVLSL